MKRISIISFTLALVACFASCKKDEVVPEIYYGSNYIINYGSYSGDKGEISVLNVKDTSVSNSYYKSINDVDLVSNIQYAYNTNGKIYFMGNNADQVFYVDEKTFEQTANGISGTDLIKPRYCVATDNMMFVSCWGGDVWDDPNLSFITCIDLNTNTVVDKISLPGGPEGLAISNGKLYAALNYEKKIAVINLSNKAISYINAPAVSSYFVKDKNNNLYVSLVSTYSTTADQEGIGYINTQTDAMTVYELSGVSTSYVNILGLNKDQSKLYVMTSAYDINWDLSGAISVFDTQSKTFSSTKLVSGITGLNGFSVNQQNDDIYYFVSESSTANGKMVAIKSDGTLMKEFETGISPFMMLTVNN
jgi:uncharacterized protein YpmB